MSIKQTLITHGSVALLAASLSLNAAAAATPAPTDDALRKATSAAAQAYASHDYDTAVLQYREAIKRGAGLPAKLRIVLWSNLGAALRECHKQSDAEAAFKQAIAIAEQSHLEADRSATTAMQQYAVLLRRMGRNADADQMDARALGGGAQSVPVAAVPASRKPSIAAAAKVAVPEDDSDKDKGVDIDLKKMSVDDVKKIVTRDDHPMAWYALAKKYEMVGEWGKAVETYRTIESRFPKDFKDMHFSYARALSKAGQPQDAVQELKLAMSEHPDEPAYYLYMHDYLIEVGDIKGALENDQAFLDKFPGHKDFGLISNLVKTLKEQNDLSQTKTAEKPSKWEKIHNWPKAMFPLKVYFQSDSDFKFATNKSGMTESTPEEVMARACQMWTEASQGRLSFQSVSRPEDSNIECAFTSDSGAMEDAAAAGVTAWTGYGEAPKARISLLTTDHEGNPLTREAFLDTCLHELGHAVGLEHSQNIDDIMYPSHRSKPLMTISQNDAKRVIVLYTH
jgi:tetratricopeptide (TPR) repeat protein